MRDISTRAYAQWVVINITNSSSKTIVIKNVSLHWGKFYRDGDKDAEIPTSDIENHKINPGDEFEINSCGRSDAASGTECDFDIYEDGGPKVQDNSKWIVESEGANLDSGALGNIKVELYKKP
ncbi:Aegerolysin-domain-containing protein [Russula aff. rugulosa BPL654]|nr:Aegerolysin-domain-containing protein [Russula aff. rugulosa BPL654]